MKTNFVITILLFYSSFLYAQMETSFKYTGAFEAAFTDKRKVLIQAEINDYTSEEIKTNLSKNVFTRTITYSITNKTLTDSMVISALERRHIDSCVEDLRRFKWTLKELEKAGLSHFIVEKDADNLQNDFNHIVYNIAKPIFIRDSSVCFFYYDYSCGSFCGHGELSLLKFENNKWVKWRTLYSFDN